MPIAFCSDSSWHRLKQLEKQFFAADNSMAIRRAALRRERPHRGQYAPGEWVMIWRHTENSQGWTGPAKVIQQGGNCAVFCRHLGNLIRAAPEHARPVSALEASTIPEQMPSSNNSNTNSSDRPPNPVTPNNSQIMSNPQFNSFLNCANS